MSMTPPYPPLDTAPPLPLPTLLCPRKRMPLSHSHPAHVFKGENQKGELVAVLTVIIMLLLSITVGMALKHWELLRDEMLTSLLAKHQSTTIYFIS
jgi:hypothetical protein